KPSARPSHATSPSGSARRPCSPSSCTGTLWERRSTYCHDMGGQVERASFLAVVVAWGAGVPGSMPGHDHSVAKTSPKGTKSMGLSLVQAEGTLQGGNLAQQSFDVAVHPHALVIAGGAAVLRRFTEEGLLPVLPVGTDARERLGPVFRGAIQ